jgi:hypothetical protein
MREMKKRLEEWHGTARHGRKKKFKNPSADEASPAAEIPYFFCQFGFTLHANLFEKKFRV